MDAYLMELYRKIYDVLKEWKSRDKKHALLLSGARQIGKTHSVRRFASENYEHFLEINFIADPKASRIFDDELTADVLITNLTAYYGRRLIPGKTLIFLDEVQECPRARTAIKFLVDDGRFDYIESGSLLGVQYRPVPSYPVGYEDQITMYPLSLEEFCISSGMQEQVIAYLKDCREKCAPVSQAVHEIMTGLFRNYLAVGGMPAAVDAFLSTHDMAEVKRVQDGILKLYRQDIIKYSQDEHVRITAIFDRIPAQLEDKNRRFKLASINRTARLWQYEDAFVWLQDAGVALPCFNLSAPTAPLKLNEQSRLFKLYMCDVGLLVAMLADQNNKKQFAILTGDRKANLGGVYENFFAQQLKSMGYELRYLNRTRIGELDFVLEDDEGVSVLEIKSGAGYMTHAALNHALEVKDWHLSRAVVFCGDNVRREEKITYLPWYMVMFLNGSEAKISRIDITSDIARLNAICTDERSF